MEQQSRHILVSSQVFAMFLSLSERSIEFDLWVGDPPTCGSLDVALKALEVMIMVRIHQV